MPPSSAAASAISGIRGCASTRTAEYRTKAKFKAIGSYTEFCPGGRCFDVYDGNHSAVVLMANGYIDLGTWMCLTPFVGGGVGYARHSIGGFTTSA